MTRITCSLLTLLSLSATLLCSPVFAENTKEQDIMLMLKVSGQAESSQQVLSTMIPQLTQLITQVNPELSKSELQELMKHLEGVLKQELPRLLELLVPVYAKHFSHQEIKELIAFYSSPIGKKFVLKQSLIIPESMAIGQRWGQEAAQKALQSAMNKLKK